MGGGVDIERNTNILKGRQHHLEDEGLINGYCGTPEIAISLHLIFGIDLPEDLVPVAQVIEGRVIQVVRRRSREDRLEQRRQLAVGRRVIAILFDVVGNTLGVLLKPSHQRQAHGSAATDGDVFRHHRAHKLDHGLDIGFVGLARQPGLMPRPHRIAEKTGGFVCGRRQHLRVEIDAREAGGEMELRRRQQFDPVGGIIGRADFVEMGEVDFIAA